MYKWKVVRMSILNIIVLSVLYYFFKLSTKPIGRFQKNPVKKFNLLIYRFSLNSNHYISENVDKIKHVPLFFKINLF